MLLGFLGAWVPPQKMRGRPKRHKIQDLELSLELIIDFFMQPIFKIEKLLKSNGRIISSMSGSKLKKSS